MDFISFKRNKTFAKLLPINCIICNAPTLPIREFLEEKTYGIEFECPNKCDVPNPHLSGYRYKEDNDRMASFIADFIDGNDETA